IPNMDGFPNGRRLEDDVTTIELQAVGGVVLAAIGLWYDDFQPGGSPVTPNLVKVLGFNAGVTKNDTTFKAAFPFEQDPWRGFLGNQYVGPQSTTTVPLSATVTDYNCSTGDITFGRIGGDPARAVEFSAAGVVNGVYGPSVNRQIEFGVRNDPNTKFIVVNVRYVGDPSSRASYTFNFREFCAKARISAEGGEPLSVRVLGNPTPGNEVTVEVRGASGKSLQIQVSDSQGQRFGQQTVGLAGAVERRTVRLGQRPGVYFLQVSTPNERQTIKVVRH
ncbi:T9SS type A sorting domain-containing protein, partial [Larkinella soli]|uniref:T9SS type A sorting domain-containing protein n=1 Tax=Larkinella soli TaxID=1770527 RepID=UPI000FFC993A